LNSGNGHQYPVYRYMHNQYLKTDYKMSETHKIISL
jgi:hypothetical protein